MRFPSKRQWLQLFKVLDQKEKTLFLAFLLLFFISLPSLVITVWIKDVERGPAVGGTITEGIVGAPRFINPIYAAGNDADRDLVELIFSGLMKYDQKGEIVYDLAKMINVKNEGREYDVYIKEDVFWHDGKKLTVDDIIFTLETIQDSDYKSPLRGNYLGIKTEKVHDHLMRLEIEKPYAGFKERLTFKILPKHIWQDISPQNFFLNNHNWQPVGSGPYKFKEPSQSKDGAINSLQLTRFNKYFADGPYISEINFRFFSSEEELIREIRAGRINSFSLSETFSPPIGFKEYSFSFNRYFAIFLNIESSEFLAKKEIRQALNYGTDKEVLVKNFLASKGEVLNYYPFDPEKAEELLKISGLEKRNGTWVKVTKGKTANFKSDLKEGSRGAEVTALQTCLATDPEVYPQGIISGNFGNQTKAAVIAFQEKYSQEILAPAGLKSGTGTVGPSTRTKLNEICSEPATETEVLFTLLTVQDPILEKVATAISQQWKELGITLKVKTHPVSQLEKDFIKPREYEMLLFGQMLSIIPDPFPFWHSSQSKDPGLNLSKYHNSKVDNLLQEARSILDPVERENKMQEFESILTEDAPMVFLYNPDYLYWASPNINGIREGLIADPSKRFRNINEWYISTKRL